MLSISKPKLNIIRLQHGLKKTLKRMVTKIWHFPLHLKEDRVYLVIYLNIGTLQALELYNDSEEGIDIHHAKTMESFIANTPAPRKEPVKASTGKQTKHTNSQRLAEEAAKGKPKLPFEEIVPKEYWSYRKVLKG